MSDTVIKWVSTGKRLNAETDGAEKKIVSFIPKELEIAREHQQLEKQRSEHKAHIIKQVAWFRNTLDSIQMKLDEKASYNERQAKMLLQQLLENFEGRLSSFKLVMRGEFDRLEDEERMLTMEIAHLEQNLAAYTSSAHIPEVNEEEEEKKREIQVQKNQQRLNDDVAHKAAIGEVDRDLATLGRCGDWDPRDHDAFVRVWNSTLAGTEVVHRVVHHADNADQAKPEIAHDHGPETLHEDAHGSAFVAYEVQINPTQKAQLVKKMEFHVLGKKRDEILSHIEWYSKVLVLMAKKKQLLSDWRRAQQRRRSLPSDQSIDPAEEERLLQADDRLDEDKLAREEERLKRLEEQRLTAKMRVAKWKADKQKQEEHEKAEKQRLSEREQKLATEKKEKQAAVKMQLEAWKQSSGGKKEKVASPPSSPRKTDPAELRRRQEQDLELARQRKEKLDEIAMKTNERERRVTELLREVKPVAGAERDPSRVLSGTKAYEAGKVYVEDLDEAEHKRATRGAHSATIAMSGRDLQFTGRAKPTWMRPPK
eukprot:gene29120-35146_t